MRRYFKHLLEQATDATEWLGEIARIVKGDGEIYWQFSDLREAVEDTEMLFGGKAIDELSNDERDGVTRQLRFYLDFLGKAGVLDTEVKEPPPTKSLRLGLLPETHFRLSKRGSRVIAFREWRQKLLFARVVLFRDAKRLVARLKAPISVFLFVFTVARVALQADTIMAVFAALVAGLLAAIPTAS
ncbi:hypothetical protein [Maricaulis virginensis]|uniref:Uncharacterized protein n=1 Tax=Maricaulis virginensis TaxID=144022 RepID=A0A9W6ILH0_9PROT|nr:hypothetical protein [Maricaulis virginensis]GLK51156.1 hypothetical protein GCM10017621_06640 [Maricaulis virginensis]